jgi:Domain of unknown function (DUF5078)
MSSRVYYERYMIDYNNKSPEVHQAVQDRIHWFFSMDYAGRRQYSEDTATNAFYEQLAWNWPNWAKLFFNNKGVAAHTTDNCAQYSPADLSVWSGPRAAESSRSSACEAGRCGGAADDELGFQHDILWAAALLLQQLHSEPNRLLGQSCRVLVHRRQVDAGVV